LVSTRLLRDGNREKDYVRGGNGSGREVHLVYFGDFLCPYCRRLREVLSVRYCWQRSHRTTEIGGSTRCVAMSPSQTSLRPASASASTWSTRSMKVCPTPACQFSNKIANLIDRPGYRPRAPLADPWLALRSSRNRERMVPTFNL